LRERVVKELLEDERFSVERGLFNNNNFTILLFFFCFFFSVTEKLKFIN